MNELKFIELSLKKLGRSKNFQKKLFSKILLAILYLFYALYAFGIIVGSYFLIKKKFPDSDAFIKINNYIYIFFFFALYGIMFIPNDNEDVRGFMLLPIKKTRIIRHHILKNLLNPINIILFISVLALNVILILEGYNIVGIISWFFAVISSLIILNILMNFGEKNQILGAFFSLGLLLIAWKFKNISHFLKPMGEFYYKVYTNPIFLLIFLLLAFLSYYLIFLYLKKRFYLDTGFRKKKNKNFMNINLSWADKYGKTGSFLKNDIRLIIRNPRTKQLLFGMIIILVFGFLIYASSIYKNNEFMKIYFAFFITGYFIIGFGGLIPSWDGKYYKLLMSQNIKYREYLESKWWLMIISVVLMTLLSLPYVYFGKDIFGMIIAMAMLNIGYNSFIVLYTGVFNTTAIDLDKKVKAFQNQQTFKFSLFIISFLRIFLPMIIYFLLYKFFGLKIAVTSMFVIGIIGILMKNILLNKISEVYKKRKYKMIESYSSDDK